MNDEMETGKDRSDRILREQVSLAVQQLPTMQTASFIVALVLSFTVRNIVLRTNIFAWIFMILVIVVCRIVFYYRFRKVRDVPFAVEYWKNSYLTLSLISGIVWGLSAFLIFPAGNAGLTYLFVLVIASLSAATTVSHSSIKLGPISWAGPAMVFYAIRFVMEGVESGYVMSILIVVYLFTIIRYSFIHNSTIMSAISLKFANLDLLEEVRKANDVLGHEIKRRKKIEEELRQHAALQETLLNEVNHRVKNNLAQILSLIHLEQDKLRDEEALMVLPFLSTLEGRIDGLATVHSMLSANKWQAIGLSALCEQIISAVTRTLSFSASVKLHVTPSDRMVSIDQAQFLTIVLNELAMNSLKHAVWDKDELHIDVEIIRTGGKTSIRYSDDGPGYPEALLAANANWRNGGFGLLYGIVKHSLKGNVEIKNDRGAVTTVTF